jgi:hypothetical protein
MQNLIGMFETSVPRLFKDLFMPRYTQDQLYAMAHSAIYHKTSDPRAYNLLIMHVHLRTGLPQNEIEQRIIMMTNNDFSFEGTA